MKPLSRSGYLRRWSCTTLGFQLGWLFAELLVAVYRGPGKDRCFPVEVLSLGLHFVAGSEDVLARLTSLHMLRVHKPIHDILA